MSKAGRPKGTPQSAEAKAKIAAAVRARWSGPERKTLHAAAAANLESWRANRRRPLSSTEQGRLFLKIAKELGAAAAHAELRRGA